MRTLQECWRHRALLLARPLQYRTPEAAKKLLEAMYQVRSTFYQLKTDCRPTLNVNAARLHRMRAIVDETIRLKFPTYMRAFCCSPLENHA